MRPPCFSVAFIVVKLTGRLKLSAFLDDLLLECGWPPLQKLARNRFSKHQSEVLFDLGSEITWQLTSCSTLKGLSAIWWFSRWNRYLPNLWHLGNLETQTGGCLIAGGQGPCRGDGQTSASSSSSPCLYQLNVASVKVLPLTRQHSGQFLEQTRTLFLMWVLHTFLF